MNVWTNTLVRSSNGGEVQLGFGFLHSLIAALQEEAWLQQLSTINCHLIPPPANHYYSAHKNCAEDERTTNNRPGARALAQREHHPDRIQHRLHQRREHGLHCGNALYRFSVDGVRQTELHNA